MICTGKGAALKLRAELDH